MSTKKVMIMAGGTGGHIFPGLTLARSLTEKGFSVSWLGAQKGMENTLIPPTSYPFYRLSIGGIRGKGIFRLMKAPFMIAQAIFQAIKIFRKEKPQLVIGMGGYASGPGGIAAWLMHIPLIIHEQNSIGGKTNKILSRFSKSVMLGFPDAIKSKKSVFTGNPVKQDFFVSAPKKRESGPLHILIVGGSLGAQKLNDIIPRALSSFNVSFDIWHQTGKGFAGETQALYEALHLNARVVPFIENMKQAYDWADIVICRAGAMTVAEVSAAGCPAILIPFPYAVDNHQFYNAKYLVDRADAIIIPQNELTIDRFNEALSPFVDNTGLVYEASQKMLRSANKEALSSVLKICEEVLA